MPVTVTAPLSMYFPPLEKDEALGAIVALIDGAQHSVYMMMFQLSKAEAVASLGRAVSRGVDVKIILDKTEEGTKVELVALHSLFLSLPPANVRIGSSRGKGFMHRKTTIVDGTTVVTGSLNLSASGMLEEQDAAIITHADLAAACQEQFDGLWQHITEREPAYRQLQ